MSEGKNETVNRSHTLVYIQSCNFALLSGAELNLNQVAYQFPDND